MQAPQHAHAPVRALPYLPAVCLALATLNLNVGLLLALYAAQDIESFVSVRPTAYRAERLDLRCSAAWRQRRCRRDERSGWSVSGSGGVAA